MKGLKEGAPSTELPVFTVFYDAQCPVCKREIDMLRRGDAGSRKIRFVDLSSREFEADATGRPLDQLMREIHGRYEDGSWLVGVDVFREIYRRMGWGWIVAITQWPVVRPLGDLAYAIFAHFRYRAAIRRQKRDSKDCTDACRKALPWGETR